MLLVLVSLTASCAIVANPASSSNEVVENFWAYKAPMPTPRSALGVAVVDGKIYAIGGDALSTARGDALGTNEMYDPVTDVWTTKAPMPTPRWGFGIAVYQNKIYCIGGKNSRANEVYDPATDTWETEVPMPTARWQLQANVANGKIYLMDGVPNRTLNEVYDPVANSWTTKTSIPFIETGYNAVGDYYASAVVDNKIYLIGVVGFFPEGEGDRLLNQMYNPETDVWSLRAPSPSGTTPAAAGVTTGVWAPKRIHVIGKDRSNRAYDPTNDRWTGGNSVPTSLGDFGVAVANDKLYVIGGKGFDWRVYHFTPSEVNEQYTPVGYGTIPPVVSVLSPENNKTYAVSNASLTLTVNRLDVWMGYSLDGKENVTITGNTTIAGLTSGLHNITIYVKDSFENTGASETISFVIAEPEPFPPMLVAVAAVAVAVGSVGVLVYFRKRNY